MTDTTRLEPLSIDTVPGMTDEEAAFLDEHSHLKPARTERVFGTPADWLIGIPAGVLLALLAVVGALALGAVEGARALRSALLSITPGGRQ